MSLQILKPGKPGKRAQICSPENSGCTAYENCGAVVALDVLSGKWKATILWLLRNGPLRSHVLRRQIPLATQRVATLHLREMEEHGLIEKSTQTTIPPQVSYRLTPLGRSSLPLLEALHQWGLAFENDKGRSGRELLPTNQPA